MADSDIIARLLLKVNAVGTEQIAAVGAELRTLNAEAAKTSTAGAAAAMEKTGVSAKNMAAITSTALLGIGGAAAVAAVAGSDLAARYESSLTLIATQAGAGEGEVRKISSALLEMGPAVGEGPIALSKALFFLESSGLRGSAALAALRASAEAAAIGHANLTDVTRALIGAEESHIAGLGNVTHATALFVSTVGRGLLTLPELVSALGTGVLPAAHAVGLSFLDIGAALDVLTLAGMPADAAATRLRMNFSQMEAPTAKASRALESIGLTSTSLASDMHKPQGLLVALQDLKSHMDKAGEQAGLSGKQLQVFEAQIVSQVFGGGRSSAAITTLLGNLDQLKSKYGEISAGAQEFGKSWSLVQKDVQFQWKQLQSEAEVLGVEIGQALIPALHDIAAAIIPVGKHLDEIIQSHKNLIGPALAAGLALGGVGLAMKGAMALTSPYQAMFTTLSGLFRANAIAATEDAVAVKAAAGANEMLAAPTRRSAILVAEGGMALDSMRSAASKTAVVVGSELGPAVGGVEGLMPAMSAEAFSVGGALDAMAASAVAAAGPLGLAALAIGIGVIAYEKSPAFKKAVDTDIRGALYLAQDDISAVTTKLHEMGDALAATGAKLDALGSKAGTGKNAMGGLGSFLNSIAQNIPMLGQQLRAIEGTHQALQDEAKGHDAAAAAAKRHTDSLKSLLDMADRQRAAQATGGVTTQQYAAGGSVSAQQTLDAASFEKQVKQISSNLKGAMDAVALALMNGGRNIGAYTAEAVKATEASRKLGDAQIQAAIRVDTAAGDFAGALKAQSDQAKTALAQAESHIALTIASHGVVTQQMIEQGRQAVSASGVLSKAQQEAARLIGDGGSKAQKALTDLASQLQQTASKTMSALVDSAFKGTSGAGLDALEKKAIAAAIGVQRHGDISLQESVKVALGAQQFGKALDSTRNILETSYKNAQAKVVFDLQNHSTSLAADRSSMDESKRKLDDFNRTVSETNATATSLKDQLDKTKTRLENDLNIALATAQQSIMLHGHATAEDTRNILAAQAKVKSFDDAAAAAKRLEGSLDSASHSANRMATDEKSKDQKALDDATARVVYQIQQYGHANYDEIQSLYAAKAAVDGNKKAWDEVTKMLKGPVADSFASREADAKKKSEQATEDLSTKLYDLAHHITDNLPPLSELKTRAISAAQSVIGYTKAHDDAGKLLPQAAAKVDTSFKGLSASVQKLADTSLSHLEKALLTGVGNLDTLSLSAATDAIKLESFGLATAEASVRVGLLTGQLDQVLKGLGDLATRARTQAVGQIVAGQTPNVTGAEGIDSLLARYAVAQSAVNAVLDLSEGKLDAFGKDVSEVSDYLKGQFFAGIVAGQGASQALIAQMVGLAQATTTVKESEDGLSAILAAATGSLSEMSKSVGDLQGIFQTQWEQAILSGAGAQNQYTGQLLASIQAQRDLTTAQNDEKVILGMLSGDAKLLADGLQGIFSQSMDKLSYFDDMIGRTGDGLAASSGNVETLTTDALSAADSLGSFGDIVKGVGDVLAQLYDAGAKEVASMGQVTDATLAAAGAAYQQSQNLTGAGILSRLEIDKANHDVVDYAADLGDEFKFLQKKLINDEAQYGAGSPQVAADRAKLTQVQNEQTGLQSVIDAGGDFSKIGATDQSGLDTKKREADQAAATVIADQAALTKAQHDYGVGSQQAAEAQRKLTDDQNKAGDSSKAYTDAVNKSGDAVTKATWAWGQFISGGIDPGIDALNQFSNFLKTTGTPTVQGLTTSMTTSHDEVVALGLVAADVATKLGDVATGLVKFATGLTAGLNAQVLSVVAGVVNVIKGGVQTGDGKTYTVPSSGITGGSTGPTNELGGGVHPLPMATLNGIGQAIGVGAGVGIVNTVKPALGTAGTTLIQSGLTGAGYTTTAATTAAGIHTGAVTFAGIHFASTIIGAASVVSNEFANLAGQLPKLIAGANPYKPFTDVPIAGGGQWHGPMTDQNPTAPTTSPPPTTGPTGTPYTPYTGPTTGTGPTGEGGSQYVFPGGNGELSQIAQNTAKTADNTQKQLEAANQQIAKLQAIIAGQADELKVSQDAMALYRQPGNRNLINGANQAGFFSSTNAAANANPSGTGAYR